MAGLFADFHLRKVLLLFLAVCLFVLGGIGLDHRSAHAADLETWRHCMQTGSPALSIKDCTAIIGSGTESADNAAYAYLYRGQAYAFCHRNELAAKDYGGASRLQPRLAHPYYGLGQLALRSEDYATAEAAFSKAVASDGEDADVGAFTRESLGRFKALPLTLRGFARYKKGDVTQALADYTEAMKICPTCSMAARNIGFLLSSQHKFDEALAAFDRAIAIEMRTAEAFWGRGVVLALASKFEPAVANYTEAIRLKPNFIPAYKNRASAYAKLGKSKEAAEDARQATALEQAAEAARMARCERVDPADDGSGPAGDEDEEVGDPVRAVDATGLDDVALAAVFSGKKWEARQGLWRDEIEFRRDGSFRQHARDETRGGRLEVTMDGAWAVSRGRLCIYTNVSLCLIGHVAGGNVSLARTDGTLEYFGPASKLQSLAANDTTSPIREFPLDEQLWPGAQNIPKGRKTLLYFIHGFSGSPRMHSPMEHYFVRRIQEAEGWDIIDADFPFKLDSQLMYGEASKLAAATYVARRIKELKAQGYERIVVGGQSVGAWTSLVLSTQPGLPLDGTILLVPACCAWRAGNDADPKHPEFANNKLYFDQLIERVRYPTVAVFFDQDSFEPGDRGASAAATLKQHGIPNLIIDHPPGFEGHGAAWLPVFDYGYRPCIVAFLRAPRTARCQPPSFVAKDFRTMFTAAQLGDWKAKTLSAAEVIGKEFAIYPTGYIYKIVSESQTEMKDYDFGDGLVTSSFRDGRYCVRGRIEYQLPASTGEVCMRLVRWSSREVLALDETSGTVSQWWVEQ